MPELITDDGVRLHYAVRGRGSIFLVCLHWMGGECAGWNSFCDALDPARFTVVTTDCRGHGRSQSEACAFTNERLARDVIAVADACGAGRFAVAGHSFGGKIALRLAAMTPERLTGLVLIGALGPGLVPLERPTIEGIVRRAGEPGFIREVLRPFFCARDRAEIEEALAAFARTPEWALLAVCETAMWTDFSREISPLTIPALVIAGDQDPVYGPDYQERAVLPFVRHASFVTVTDCGHGLILEQPRIIADHARRFLTEHARP
jgi:pimeloyl-ACP methyl ester carboxylesterase